MTNLSRIASALCVASLFIGEAAIATPELTPVEKEHIHLLQLVEALGVEVLTEGPPCDKGWHGGYRNDGAQLVLCPGATSAQNERLDTIRHESWHVYQDLKDCNLKDTAVARPIFTDGIVPNEYKAYTAKNYTSDTALSEAEAYWAANTFNAEQINILIFSQAKSCGYKF